MKSKLIDKKDVISFSVVVIVLAILTIIVFTNSTSIVKHSDKNTYEVSGIVTDFEYVNPGYFGKKIRHPHVIHLDNGTDCTFNYYNYEMYYNDPNQEKIRDELEGKYVVIRLSKKDDSVITIKTDEKYYLSYEASNRQYVVGVIGVALFDFSVLFTAFIVLIYPISSPKKRFGKKTIHK